MAVVTMTQAFMSLVGGEGEGLIATWKEAIFNYGTHEFEVHKCVAPVTDGHVDLSQVDQKLHSTAHVDYYDTVGMTLKEFERSMQESNAVAVGYINRGTVHGNYGPKAPVRR